MVKNSFKDIGILGGSFDPPHKGHLYVSKQSLKRLKLKKVIWAITKKIHLKIKLQKIQFSLTQAQFLVEDFKHIIIYLLFIKVQLLINQEIILNLI